jgi:hypothetical protein
VLRKGEVEVQLACALVSALDNQEITLSEFADGLTALTSEAVQVIATALRACGGPDETGFERLNTAYQMCRKIAGASRVLS